MKVWNYVFISVALSLFFWMAGIEIGGMWELLTNLGFINSAGSLSLNSNNIFRTVILGVLVAAGVAGIAIGVFTKAKTESYVVLPILTGVGLSFGLVTFINLGYSIINYGFSQAGWIGYITLMIFGTLTIGFIFALVEFFKGTD